MKKIVVLAACLLIPGFAAARIGFGNGGGGSSSSAANWAASSSNSIQTSGSVGIGTSSPATKLHLSSGTLTIDGSGGSLAINGPTGATLSTSGSSMTVTVNGSSYGIFPSSITAPNGYVISMATQTYVITISSGSGWNSMSWPVFSAPDNTSVTLLKITAVAMPASSTVTYQLDERTLAATNSAGSSIFSVAYSTANNTGVTTTSFSDSSIAAGSGLVFTTPSSGASAGAPAAIKITLYYKRDN